MKENMYNNNRILELIMTLFIIASLLFLFIKIEFL